MHQTKREIERERKLGYRKSVPDVDDEGVRVRADSPPTIIGEDLEALDFVLLENGERAGIEMGPCA